MAARVEELVDQFYRLLADSIPQMVWSSKADGRNEYCNERACAYTGLAPAELAGWGWQAVIHPQDKDRCQAAWQQALERGARYEVEYRLRRRDGVYLWHLCTAEPLKENGRIVRWFGTCTDIEGRKKAERELEEARLTLEELVVSRTVSLRESEKRLREIIQNEPECVKLLDASGNLLEMNAAGLRMIEADSLEQVRGKCIYEVIAPEHREAFREVTERVCRGERGTLEFELVGLKGTRRWMQTHAVPFRDESRGETLLLGITRDVTEQRGAEQALRESEARFRSLAELSSDWYWEQDENLRFAAVSPQIETAVGLFARADVGKMRWELPTVGVSPEQWAQHRRTLEARLPFRDFEYQRLNDRGEPIWISVSGEPMFDELGRFRGYRGVGRNVTESHRLERAVRQLLGRMVQTQEDERRKVAGDLHDLIGQKLTALGINLDIVRQRVPQAGAVALAHHLHQMSTLLEETIGAIREVMSDLRPQVLDEHGLSAALYQYASAFEARTGLRVQVKGADSRLPLPRDVAIALFRIAQEALTNAAKHSGASHIVVRVDKRTGRVELRVEDDGRGMPGDGAAREAGNGAGWGLPMMRERAESVGGRLRIERAERGTRIVVEVPLDHADQRHPG